MSAISGSFQSIFSDGSIVKSTTAMAASRPLTTQENKALMEEFWSRQQQGRFRNLIPSLVDLLLSSLLRKDLPFLCQTPEFNQKEHFIASSPKSWNLHTDSTRFDNNFASKALVPGSASPRR